MFPLAIIVACVALSGRGWPGRYVLILHSTEQHLSQVSTFILLDNADLRILVYEPSVVCETVDIKDSVFFFYAFNGVFFSSPSQGTGIRLLPAACSQIHLLMILTSDIFLHTPLNPMTGRR
jgi:hypothetical protein